MAYLARQTDPNNPRQQSLEPGAPATPALFEGGSPPPPSEAGAGVPGGSSQASPTPSGARSGFGSWGEVLDGRNASAGAAMAQRANERVDTAAQGVRSGLAQSAQAFDQAAQGATVQYGGGVTAGRPWGGYRGPTELDTTTAQAGTAGVQRSIRELQDPGLRAAALQRDAGPRYNANWAAADGALMGTASGGFDALRERWSGLEGEVGAAAQTARERVSRAQAESADAQSRARAADQEHLRNQPRAPVVPRGPAPYSPGGGGGPRFPTTWPLPNLPPRRG